MHLCALNEETYLSIVLQRIKPSSCRKLSDQKTLRVSMNCNLQGLVLTTNISEQWVKTLSEKTTIKLLFREIILQNLRQGQLLLSLLKATIKQFPKNLITQLFQENKTFKKEFQAL